MIYLYNLLIHPRSVDEDHQRREFILNILLLGSILLTLAAVGILINDVIRQGDTYNGAPLVIVLFPLLLFVGIYILARIKFYNIAAYIFTSIYFLLAVYTLYSWGIVFPLGIALCAFVIVMAGVLINTFGALIFTVLIAVSLTLVERLQSQGIVIPDLSWTTEPLGNDSVVYIFVLGVITLVSWLSNREIERSLVRARKSEEALKKERDLLEIKVDERTRELRQAQREQILQLSKFAEFGRLASGVFHDIVNPLMSVSMNLEEMGTKAKSERLNRAIEGTKRMMRYIESARKQVQNQDEITTFSLNEEIEQAVELIGFKAKKNSVHVTFHQSKKIKTLGNAVKFHQMITNLVSNAIDAYENVTRTVDRNIEITLSEKKDMIAVTVEDWASGIEEENLDKIFESFFTTKTTDKGTGLGLSIIKETIENEFHGKISVVSEKGKGTTFTLTFPHATDK